MFFIQTLEYSSADEQFIGNRKRLSIVLSLAFMKEISKYLNNFSSTVQ